MLFKCPTCGKDLLKNPHTHEVFGVHIPKDVMERVFPDATFVCETRFSSERYR